MIEALDELNMLHNNSKVVGNNNSVVVAIFISIIFEQSLMME
jgi:hypothetical protein